MHRDFASDLSDHLHAAERRIGFAVLAANCSAYEVMVRHLREAQAHIEEVRRLTAENVLAKEGEE